MTLFEMKENLYGLTNEKNAVDDWIATKAADPTVPMAEIETKKAKSDELGQRIAILEKAVNDEEDKQRKQLAMKEGGGEGTGMTKAEAKTKAKADFYRAALTGGDVAKAYEGLGAIPNSDADLGNGDRLLPTSVSNELLTEPLEENTLRNVELVSQIPGLEEHKLNFTIEDADLEDVTDKQTAKEIEAEGDTISYGRFKTKIYATVKDTVLHGSNHDIVTTIENALRSGLAIKEKLRAFAPATGAGAYDDAHKHMSFYAKTATAYDIKEVKGTDIIEAITNAWADLPEAFATNAKVVMRKSDYYKAIRTLANGSNDLWGKKPEDVLGIPVEFNDRATIPVVGDFRYARLNYDIGAMFDTDKDGKAGEYYFILTAWFDHVIRLKSAFRLATVGE